MEIIFNRESVLLGGLVPTCKGSSRERGLFRDRVLIEEGPSWMKEHYEGSPLQKERSSWRNVLIGKSPHGERSL